MHRFEISAVIDAGIEFQENALLPKLSPGSDSRHLIHKDLEAFDDRFHRHVHLKCGCLVHHATCIAHLKSILKKAAAGGDVEADLDRSDGLSAAVCDAESEMDTLNSLTCCPHRHLCQHFTTTGERAFLTEEDIDTIVQFGAERLHSRHPPATSPPLVS